MQNQIGGLFETQDTANQAYQTLQNSGFSDKEIDLLIPKPRNRTIRATRVKVQDIALSAVLGGLILGLVGAFIGFLVGSGRLTLPALEGATSTPTPELLIASVISGLVGGGLTGIILGVAFRLLRSQEKAEVVTRKIKEGGVLLTVAAGDAQGESKATRIMEENGAIEVGKLSEKWDLDAWINPNEKPSLVNAR